LKYKKRHITAVWQNEEGILITDVYDTRQNPIKMNNPERKQNPLTCPF